MFPKFGFAERSAGRAAVHASINSGQVGGTVVEHSADMGVGALRHAAHDAELCTERARGVNSHVSSTIKMTVPWFVQERRACRAAEGGAGRAAVHACAPRWRRGRAGAGGRGGGAVSVDAGRCSYGKPQNAGSGIVIASGRQCTWTESRARWCRRPPRRRYCCPRKQPSPSSTVGNSLIN